jgi:elongation factor P
VIAAGEFRNGITFELDEQVFQVVEFQHVKPGKGAAFVRTRLKNVVTGATIEKTFTPTDKMPKAHIDRRDMQYLYNDGNLYYFMDTENYEQLPLSAEQIGDYLKFIKENMVVKILSYKGDVFGVEPPTFVELEVTHTEPGFKGDTATGATKPATLETGAILKVPLFINEGDIVRVDTRTGEYMERV